MTMEPAHAAFLDAWRAQEFHVPLGPWPRPAPPKPVLPGPIQLPLFDMDGDPEAPPASPPLPSALLTALIDDAGVGRRRPRDIAIVEAAIAASIPADVPTFADEILSARRDGEDRGDDHGDDRVPEVLAQPGGDPVDSREVRGVAQPGEGVEEEVHGATTFCRAQVGVFALVGA